MIQHLFTGPSSLLVHRSTLPRVSLVLSSLVFFCYIEFPSVPKHSFPSFSLNLCFSIPSFHVNHLIYSLFCFLFPSSPSFLSFSFSLCSPSTSPFTVTFYPPAPLLLSHLLLHHHRFYRLHHFLSVFCLHLAIQSLPHK